MSHQDKCVCPAGRTRRECIEIRYGDNALGEECECVCHDEDDEEYADVDAWERYLEHCHHVIDEVYGNRGQSSE